MDVLDKLVELAQLAGSVDTQCLFQGAWYVRHEASRVRGVVHIVTRGSGWIKIDGENRARLLQQGDIVFFPRTAGHVLSSSAGCGNCDDTVESSRQGAFTVKSSSGEGGQMQLFCARFEYEQQAELIAGLPAMLRLNLESPELCYLVEMLKGEAAGMRQGSTSVVNALSAVLLVLMLRAYLAQEGQELPEGVLKGWRDKRLRGLIQAVIEQPEKPWNVEDMATEAKMSRAHLMRLFRQQTGSSPHAFVSRIRLQQAALLLKQRADSVLSIALSVGFSSETHFGKAFKKEYGISPGQYRKQPQEAVADGGFVI